ncbi:MAG: D-2-hydroxyacid dehydrogenase [Proteobacteria bacterium]|nr:D-2-hydroxyacid dehydrogenase [Pseudomonadota bacterium]
MTLAAMKVVVHYDRPELFMDHLEARFPEVAFTCCRTYEELPEILEACAPDALYCIIFEGRDDYPRAAMLNSPSLAWISVGGSGTDHLAPWDPQTLTVTNSAGVAADVMAQYVLAAILSLSLGFPAFAAAQRERRWVAGMVKPIDGRCATVVGLGKTGRAVARCLSTMGVRVVGVRANPAPTDHVDRVADFQGLHGALGEADFVVLCLPLNERTRHCIDERAIAAMKRGTILVDVSRGGVVKGEALVAGLRSGHLAGAALDVFEHEPLPPESPFWTLENVIVTPHCSSLYEGWERRSAEMFGDNLARRLRGDALENIVDPARGY